MVWLVQVQACAQDESVIVRWAEVPGASVAPDFGHWQHSEWPADDTIRSELDTSDSPLAAALETPGDVNSPVGQRHLSLGFSGPHSLKKFGAQQYCAKCQTASSDSDQFMAWLRRNSSDDDPMLLVGSVYFFSACGSVEEHTSISNAYQRLSLSTAVNDI